MSGAPRPSLAGATLLVHDYDEAVAFFTTALGLSLVRDEPVGGDDRFVALGAADGGAGIVLARAVTAGELALVGRQAGDRVAFFLHTDEFVTQYERMRAAGVRFLEQPRHEPYGTVVVFADLYGNRWDLLEPR